MHKMARQRKKSREEVKITRRRIVDSGYSFFLQINWYRRWQPLTAQSFFDAGWNVKQGFLPLTTGNLK